MIEAVLTKNHPGKRVFVRFYSEEAGYAVKTISLLNKPSVPGAEYLEVGWK